MDSSFNSLSSGFPCPLVMKSLRVDQITHIMIVLSSFTSGLLIKMVSNAHKTNRSIRFRLASPAPVVMKSLRGRQLTRIMMNLSSYAPGVKDIDPLVGYTQLVCGHLSPSLYSEIPPPTKIPSSERSHLTR